MTDHVEIVFCPLCGLDLEPSFAFSSSTTADMRGECLDCGPMKVEVEVSRKVGDVGTEEEC